MFLAEHTAACHEIKDAKLLEDCLEKVDVSPEKLCSRLQLVNCNSLKHNHELDAFHMAKSYIAQRTEEEACWEEIVSILCELKMRRLAKEVADSQGVDYHKHCLS